MSLSAQRKGGSVSIPHIGDRLPKRNNPFMHWLGTTIMRRLGWHFEGDLPNIPKLIAIGIPHTSTWDVVIAVAAFFALEVRIWWMAKHTLFWWPFGKFMRWVGAMPIERHKTVGVVDQIVAHYQSHEQFVMALAPEGTRSRVESLKSGFYHIAVKANIPILCVGIDFGRKTIIFYPVLVPTGNYDADIKGIRELVRGLVAKHPEKSSFA